MKNIKNIITTSILFAFIMQSCSHDLLNLEPQDAVSEVAVWKDPALIELYVNSTYNILPHGFPQWAGGLRLTSLTDESLHQHQGNRLTNKYTEGGVTPSNMNLFGGFWREAYEAIRAVNLYMENIDENLGGNPDRIKQLTAEMRFIRAYFYTELFSRYGDVPLVKTSFELGGNFDMQRTPVAEIVDFIESELTLAASNLPLSQNGADFGRVTKGAAIALKARALLYGASPLFSASNSTEKWQKVADACEELFGLGMYSLSSDYQGMFFNVSDPEIIFFKQFLAEFGWEKVNKEGDNYYYYTGGHNIDRDRMPNGSDGWSGENPLQNLVDKYETIDGEIPVVGYTGSNSDLIPVLNPNATSYDINNPYENRDPRFYYSVVHDGSMFKGRVVEFWECGVDSRCDNVPSFWNGAVLDYTIRKSVDSNYVVGAGLNSSTPWIYMRLAEFYLTYAEAQYHLGNSALAEEYIDRVRSRPGVNMPPIATSQMGSDLLSKIKHERTIELAFEGNRWYDARRWLDAEVDFAEDAKGVEVIYDESTGNKTYRYFIFQNRSFPQSHYLFPIPIEEINKSGLIQNPGY